jgi:hypothetical protein
MQQSFRLTISVNRWMQFILVVPLTVASMFTLVGALQGSADALFGLIFFGLFALLGWANALSNIQITENSVTVTVFYGRFRIFWDEVENISLNYPNIALMGNGKRVVLSLGFAGKNKEQLLEFFNQQIEQRKIVFKTGAQFPITHHNSRVWR